MAVLTEKTLKSSLAGSSLHSGLRAFVLCLSFVNLCFFSAWNELLTVDPNSFKAPTETWTQLFAVILDVLILTVVLWVPVILAVHSGNRNYVRVLKWCILAGLIIPVHLILTDPLISRQMSGGILDTLYGKIGLGVLGIAFGIFLLRRWEVLSPRLTGTILTILLPAMPLAIMAAASATHANLIDPLSKNKPVLPALPVNPGAPRMLWIIFDEWDQELTFDHRPADLQLPELDRFRQQAFFADNAYAPAFRTIVSVPSLITGKTFTDYARQGATEVLESYESPKPSHALSQERTIFGEVRGKGFNVGIVAWFLPYYRIFGDFTRYPGSGAVQSTPSLAKLMITTARRQFKLFPLMRTLGIAQRQKNRQEVIVDNYDYDLSETIQTLRDARLNFVFLHLGYPHGPIIYDHAKQAFTTSPGATYLGNLALVDRTLGEIRRTLELEGRWDSTSILLTSDHPLRLQFAKASETVLPPNAQQSHRVPFMLKLAGQKMALEYPHAMQTVVTKDLLIDILNQSVTTPEQVAKWIDHHPPRQ